MSTETQKYSTDSLSEVVADIAFNAGYLLGKGKITVTDSRELVSNVQHWAKKFEDVFIKDIHSNDYMVLIDEYSTFCLLEETTMAEQVLAKMKAQLPEVQECFTHALKYMPGPTDHARLLQQIQCKSMDFMYECYNKDPIINGVRVHSAMSVQAKFEYEKTVQYLKNLLGDDASCNYVDQDKWSAFSDFHKSVNGFRPREHYSCADVDAWFKRNAS
jgi:hypothetical protein